MGSDGVGCGINGGGERFLCRSQRMHLFKKRGHGGQAKVE